jgi:mono/diheme cytochrome c family protein
MDVRVAIALSRTAGARTAPNSARPLFTSAVLSLMLGSTAALAQNPNSFPPEQLKRGATLYAANCESCHGVRMEGPPWATDLRTFPRDQSSRFVDAVTNGVRNMPPWGDVLKRDEVEALWAYVVAGEKRD